MHIRKGVGEGNKGRFRTYLVFGRVGVFAQRTPFTDSIPNCKPL